MSSKLMASTMRFRTEVDELVRARYPLVSVESFEEVRALSILREVAHSPAHIDKGFYVWSRVRGFVQVNGKPTVIDGTSAPLDALEFIAKQAKGLFVLCDFNPALSDAMDGTLITRMLRELVWTISGKDCRDVSQRARQVTIFLLGSKTPEEPSLTKELKVIELPLPDETELLARVNERVEELVDAGKMPSGEYGTLASRLAHGLLGLTEQEADNALAKATVHCKGLNGDSIKVVLDEKAALVSDIPGCEYREPGMPDGLGGYQTAVDFIDDAATSNTPEAEAFGISSSKGVLLVGVAGCGKTYTASVAAGRMQRPLLKVSMSGIMASGGGVLGQAEGAMRRVLAMADKIQPLFLVDEFEKAQAGLKGPDGDSGTTKRMIGEFMSWMSEQRGTFVIATANNVDNLDPAQARLGRFSEVLFYDLPTQTERAAIFAVQLKRKGRKPEGYDLKALAKATDGFSGAEICEGVVERGLVAAFKARAKDVTTDHLLSVISTVNPLSRMAPDEVGHVRAWAQKANARRANSPEVEVPDAEPEAPVSRGRAIQI